MGSTQLQKEKMKCPRDHPHIHGEHQPTLLMGWTVMGSPPYTWGAPFHESFSVRFLRITPIYMGSTQLAVDNGYPSRDHPHIHGEHTALASATSLVSGSPPYTWGALAMIALVPFWLRITPIYMGSTLKDPCNQAIFKSSKTLFQSVWS